MIRLLFILCMLLSFGSVYAQKTQTKKVLLDTYFNHEVDKKTGKVQHYTWDDTSKWGGYSQFGELFEKHGGTLAMLNEAPTSDLLNGSSVYIIVDPDHVKDNPSPNYMNKESAEAIAKWVKNGGSLLVLTNDRDNCDLQHINILMDKFGLHFNDTTILQLDIPTKEKPENVYPLQGTLEGTDKMYMRGTSSIECTKEARRIVWTKDNDVVIAEANYGKGLVIAVADPWIYNEYIYHTLLPDNYDNASAAERIVEQLLEGRNSQCHELQIQQKNGKNIYGIISNPTYQSQNQNTSKKQHGVAIISHGFNGTHHFGKDYFKTLNDLGYAVYTFDFPCGSVNSKSDNNTMNMSVSDEKEALKEIVSYFKKQKDIDNKKIVLIGESQGGLVSALAASELKKQVSNLILIYPALCIPDNWNARYPKVEDVPEVSEIWGVKLGKKFMMDIRPMKPFETIGKYKGRVLIVHGTDDKVVPLDYSKRAVETYNDATLKIIDKAGHGFKPEERILSNKYVKEFLSK